MRILITGVTGFVGGYLAEALLARGGAELAGTSRRTDWPPELAHLAGRVQLCRCDLTDPAAVDALVQTYPPDQVYHLAGFASAAASFTDPDAAWAGNLGATRILYETLTRRTVRPRILYVSSGLIYGEPETPGAAHDERAVLRPDSPYATSKAAADLLSYQVTRGQVLEVVRARPFNHIGPRQSVVFAVPHFAQQIAASERGQRPPVLETGNLGARRDLTDVRDVVEAYLLLMERGRPGEAYNVGRGEARSMQELLDYLLARSTIPLEARQKPGLVRAVEPAAIRADAAKLTRETGWQPHRSLEQTLDDILDSWRNFTHL